jgi:hypothetical protein
MATDSKFVPTPSGRENGSRPSDQDEFLMETMKFWQQFTERELTLEDARQIRENLTGFFGLLQDWRSTSKLEAKGGPAERVA